MAQQHNNIDQKGNGNKGNGKKRIKIRQGCTKRYAGLNVCVSKRLLGYRFLFRSDDVDTVFVDGVGVDEAEFDASCFCSRLSLLRPSCFS